MEKNSIIDSKSFYRFVEFVCRLKKKKLPHERYKLIALDKYKALSSEEQRVKRVSDSFNYLLNNINQSLSKDLIKRAYYILTNKTLDDDIIFKILSKYYEYKDLNRHYLASLIHFVVLDNVIEESSVFAFILSSFVSMKKSGKCYIPFDYIKKLYEEAKNEKSILKMIYIFNCIESKNKKSQKQVDKKELVKTIYQNKTYLEETFNIKSLFLYGSYLKDSVNEFSDIDLLVIFSNKVDYLEKPNSVIQLKEYLQQIFYINVDVIDFQTALKDLEINEMENIIKII